VHPRASAAPLRLGFTLVELLVVIGIIATLIGILLPSLSKAREQGKTVQCLSNLRQMAVAAQNYTIANGGRFPIAYFKQQGWDFSKENGEVVPGLLWGRKTEVRVQQCPSFDGKSNTAADPYTGYNYNVSYIGGGEYEVVQAPAKTTQVRRPSETVIFGDGEWSNGANKYMRAPQVTPNDPIPSLRIAGTQGFRHRGRTNVSFVDGHAETWGDRYTDTHPAVVSQIAPGCGFLSKDNSVYDLQ
jgi:prepilin-type processing-associated H-X9-DG protein/prepilin-type N-terminal cleavage/methylation domain-containing protein